MKKLSPILLIILAIFSLIVAYIYFSKTAGALPHFLPGYLAGSAHKHVKHAMAFLGLALVLFLGAWMLGGKSQSKSPNSSVEQ